MFQEKGSLKIYIRGIKGAFFKLFHSTKYVFPPPPKKKILLRGKIEYKIMQNSWSGCFFPKLMSMILIFKMIPNVRLPVAL